MNTFICSSAGCDGKIIAPNELDAAPGCPKCGEITFVPEEKEPDVLTVLQAYGAIVREADLLRRRSRTVPRKEDRAEYSARATGLYLAAAWLEKTEAVNPRKPQHEAKRIQQLEDMGMSHGDAVAAVMAEKDGTCETGNNGEPCRMPDCLACGKGIE